MLCCRYGTQRFGHDDGPRSRFANAAEVRWAAVRAAIDDYLATPASLRCDPDSIIFIEREQNRLSYAVSESLAEFDQWKEYGADGALSAAAWVDTMCHLPKKEARAQVRRGHALSGLPLAALAWKNGDIGAAQVDVLIKAKRPVTEDALAGAEASWAQAGTDRKFAGFSRVGASWDAMAAQAGPGAAALARQARRDAYLV